MTDHAEDLAADWARLGPFETCSKLGLKFRRTGNTAMVCCPWHGEHNPSCTVAIGPSQTIRVHCFPCQQTWDVHSLVAQLNGLDCQRGFIDVLRFEAETLGRWDILAELDREQPSNQTPPPSPAVPKPALPPAPPEPTYPDQEQVLELLGSCTLTSADREVSAWLRGRSLSPWDIDVRGLAYALPQSAVVPPWASYRGQGWGELGHRLIVPMVDHFGAVRSLRAGRVVEGDTPKRLPPAGCKATGIVMADACGVWLLSMGRWPSWAHAKSTVIVVEGEPDWLTVASQIALYKQPRRAVFGICSGSWTSEIAARIPDGTKVVIWTDPDKAGDQYAAKIAESLLPRCEVCRGAHEQ